MACSDNGDASGEHAEPVDPDGPLRSPELIRSVDGALALTLTAKVASVDVGAEMPVKTYTYGGVVPGRTWEVNYEPLQKNVDTLGKCDHCRRYVYRFVGGGTGGTAKVSANAGRSNVQHGNNIWN